MTDIKMHGSLGNDRVQTVESLQRTLEWLLKRKECFSGSENTLLMSCSRTTSSMSWDRIEKIVDFSGTAEKQVYRVGKRRSTNVLEMEINSKPTNYGKENESLLIANVIRDGLISDFEELGFEYFGDYKGGGASADGRCVYNGEVVGAEIKCCVSWDGHYGRMYEKVHEKHKDFWQHQSEMLAMSVDKLIYIVAEPMNINKYDHQIIEASKLHQKALLARCKIADAAIDMWYGDYTYNECLQIACANYLQENEN